MKTNTLILPILVIIFGLGMTSFLSCATDSKKVEASESLEYKNNTNDSKIKQTPMNDYKNDYKVKKSEEEWKKELTENEYRVLRQKGTERAFTGEFDGHKEKGVYTCGACHEKLFESNSKFDSGSGWPSFYTTVEGNVKEIKDSSHGMVRTEVVCNNCGSHLGHVFNDWTKTNRNALLYQFYFLRF